MQKQPCLLSAISSLLTCEVDLYISILKHESQRGESSTLFGLTPKVFVAPVLIICSLAATEMLIVGLAGKTGNRLKTQTWCRRVYTYNHPNQLIELRRRRLKLLRGLRDVPVCLFPGG